MWRLPICFDSAGGALSPVKAEGSPTWETCQVIQVLCYRSVVAGWSFLTNHALALLCIAREPGMRIRDVAECVGVTERAAHRIVGELEESGYLSRHRVGRRNFYEVHPEVPLRHPLEDGHDVGELLRVLLSRSRESEAA
jgi:hypothetical protein